MGQTQMMVHSCGYALVRDAVTDAVDVGHGLHLPAELQATLQRDQYTERCYLPIGTLLYWYDGSLDMEDAELAEREVKRCPNCGAVLPLYIDDKQHQA
jgi:hypothetical protein